MQDPEMDALRHELETISLQDQANRKAREAEVYKTQLREQIEAKKKQMQAQPDIKQSLASASVPKSPSTNQPSAPVLSVRPVPQKPQEAFRPGPGLPGIGLKALPRLPGSPVSSGPVSFASVATSRPRRRTREEVATMIQALLPKYVIPYIHSSQDAAKLLEEFGTAEQGDLASPDPELLWKWQLHLPTFNENNVREGSTQQAEFDGLPPRTRCQKCQSRTHPTDIHGKLFHTASKVYSRDPNDSAIEGKPAIELGEYAPCHHCHLASQDRIGQYHHTAHHGQHAWYLHPESLSIAEIMETAEKHEEVLMIVPHLYHWPRIQKKRPFPLHCFYPTLFPRPSAMTITISPEKTIRSGLNHQNSDLDQAVKRQLEHESKSSLQHAKYMRDKRLNITVQSDTDFYFDPATLLQYADYKPNEPTCDQEAMAQLLRFQYMNSQTLRFRETNNLERCFAQQYLAVYWYLENFGASDAIKTAVSDHKARLEKKWCELHPVLPQIEK